MSIKFGTKAETLERLEESLKTARFLPQARAAASEWRKNSDAIISTVLAPQ